MLLPVWNESAIFRRHILEQAEDSVEAHRKFQEVQPVAIIVSKEGKVLLSTDLSVQPGTYLDDREAY
jgi:hypothetical protein